MTDSAASPVVCTIANESMWPGIWSVFREVIAPGDTYMFPPDMSESDARAAWLYDGSHRRVTFAALIDGCVVATAIIRPNGIGLGDHVANGAWMVSQAARGRGVGRRLAQFVIDHARSLGFSAMQFNAVVSTNHSAIALWRSLGFIVVGTIPHAFRHQTRGLTDTFIMHRTL